jgi:hypothetical protein
MLKQSEINLMTQDNEMTIQKIKNPSKTHKYCIGPPQLKKIKKVSQQWKV